MSVAFEITEEDVSTVLADMGLPANDACEMLGRLDHLAIEKAALHGDDMDVQTGYAHDEIRRQISDMGLTTARPLR